ncbi:hypothetical protein ELQ35_10485 [Peribacillus cavernae]|uniref:Uncharacterized protein n=1 Tax=Peribacillus cavernae TaxID=1674310 RepID=A0A433HLV2_9BACI|nr:hypothetical protein [Peribacillus cavernae]MDQ0218905.1 ribosome maturation factor RimP [Peribacillus cavernae]RUQ29376.1 hypothetical protein ELQ35_10485 [Peribacillus cavernae]
MAKKQVRETFRCPEIVPPDAPDDFCIPEFRCPERIETFKFPSPTSCLPPEETEELEARIDAANELLLDLGLSARREDEERREEARREAFEGLIGQNVEVELDCPNENNPEKNRVVKGRVHFAGEDFVILRRNEKQVLIPLLKICSIDLQNRFAEPEENQQLIDIDPCLRRAITFNFGEVVSQSPQLIEIFFGLRLGVFLLTFLDQRIKAVLEDEVIAGKLVEATQDSLTVCQNGGNHEIPIDDVCFLAITD